MSAEPSRIRLSCHSCGKTYALKPELAGKTAQCGCGARLKIPAAPAAKPAPALAKQPAPPPPSPPALPPRDDAFDDNIFDAEPMDVGDLLGPDAGGVRPFDEAELAAEPADDGLELEAPPERTVPESVRRAVEAGKVAASKPGAVRRRSESSWALKFVGVYGFIIMGVAVLEGLANIVGAMFIAMRPEISLGASAILFVIVAIQTGIAYVIFRLGKGLVDSERSAVHGLVVFYVLHLVIAVVVYILAQGERDTHYVRVAIVFAALSTLIYLPPILVGYLNWSDFHEAED